MIRLINDMNGFSYFNDTNRDIMSPTNYPEQYGEYLDRYTSINYRNIETQQTFYRFRITQDYTNSGTINNYENLTDRIEQDTDPVIFRIVRFDKDGPDKAILINEYSNEVIVTKASELLKFQNVDLDFCHKIINRVDLLEKEYYLPNEIMTKYNAGDFFLEYNKETVNEFPVQDKSLLGREVWIEFEASLTDQKSDSNQITTIDNYGNIEYVKNDFKFTEEMKNNLITNNPDLLNERDSYLASYPHTYNIHAKSNIDMPRRTTTKGIIIRADVNSVDPHIVVLVIDGTYAKYICDDEARFYYDTDTENTNSNIEAFQVTKNYTPYGYIAHPTIVEEETIEENITEEEIEDNTEENTENNELKYSDVVIHI